ncbi:MAG: class I SAM-dependent methyltransferase [Candidatus Limnocylindrales bacterium]
MVFRRAFDCLWCGRAWEVRAAGDLEGWANLCPECLANADGNGFLRMRLRAALRDRAAAAATAVAPSAAAAPAAPAAPGDWEDWYLRRGAFSRGPIHDGPWTMELEQVTQWLDQADRRGVIVELGAGMGWWTGLLAEQGELWLYDADGASLDAARARLLAHGLLAHLHQRDPLAPPDKAVDVVFAAYFLGRAESPEALRARLEVIRSWLRPTGAFLLVEARAAPDGVPIASPSGSLWPRDAGALRRAILDAGFASAEVQETRSAFVFGRALAPA